MWCFTGIKVVVLMLLDGAVSGQMCPQVMNCISNFGVDISSIRITNVLRMFTGVCQNIDQLVPCYELLSDCAETSRYSGLLPSFTQIRQSLTLLCQNKHVLAGASICAMASGSGDIEGDSQQCIIQITTSWTQQNNVHESVCGAIDCFTTMPSFRNCPSNWSALMTKAVGYLKLASCTRGTSGGQDGTSGGQGLTGCLFLGLVMSFLISRICRRF